MANVSSAFGTVRVEAENFEQAKKITQIIHSITSGFGYYTHFNLDDISEVNGALECSFYGDGRWDFQNNIQNMGYWIENSSEDCKDRIKELEKHDFKITFDYTDEEGGNPFIVQVVASIAHKKDTPLESMVYELEEHEDFDYNVENLCNICGYDKDYALELCGGEDEESEVA